MFLVAFVPGLAAHIRGVGGSTPPTATKVIMIFFTVSVGDGSSTGLYRFFIICVSNPAVHSGSS